MVENKINESETVQSNAAEGHKRCVANIFANVPHCESGSRTNISFQQISRRYVLFETYCRRLARLVGKELGCRVSIEPLEGAVIREILSDCEASEGKNCLVVRLRLFQESLSVLLPLELACEISLRYLDQAPIVKLSQFGEAEATALSYFIASLLADEELFSRHRVYLSSISEMQTDRQLGADYLGAAETVIGIRVTVRDHAWTLAISFGKRLEHRFAHYAKLIALVDSRLTAVRRAKTYWNLSLELGESTIRDVLKLAPGNLLLLEGQTACLCTCDLARGADKAGARQRPREIRGSIAASSQGDCLRVVL